MPSIPPDASLSRASRSIEDVLNAVSDQDWAWWPFLDLRPALHEPLTTKRVLHMSLCFGPLMALLLLPLTFGNLTLRESIAIVLVSILVTFAIYRSTFAVAWNRRASRERVD
ncbi:MAG: hypothetical protein ACRELY_31215 [Polyangiaceae bacterium]